MSSDPNNNPLDLVRQLAGRRVKLGQGVVGKTTRATLGLLALWAIIFWRLSESSILLNVMLLGGGSIITGVFMWWVHRTQKFASDNPGLALMEGAQLLEYQKWEAGIKGYPALESKVIPDPDQSKSIGKDAPGV